MPADADVVIVRSGYATEVQWLKAIAEAMHHKRSVVAITAEGNRWRPTERDVTAWLADHGQVHAG